MFKGIESFSLSSKSMHNIPCCMYFLMSASPCEIEWFLDGWRGEDILSLTRWEEDSRYEWALHIDLEKISKPGEEAILPFPWAEENDPCLEEGIFAWRLFANEKTE